MYIKLICIIIYNIWIDNYIIEFYNENNENAKINALLRQVIIEYIIIITTIQRRYYHYRQILI